MSTNLDTLRRGLVPVTAALVLAVASASEAVADRSRRDASPPSSSSSGSGSSRSSIGDSSSSSSRSSGSSRPSGSSASSTRPSGDSQPSRIENDRRDGRYSGRHRGRGSWGGHYGGYYGGYYPGWGYYWNSPWYWGFYGYGHGYPYYGGVTVYPNRSYGDLGALDLDLAPERAEVYVDGQRVGVADDFDGFPTFLWLEQGTYDVVFYMPGFRTLARQYSIYPGLIIDVEDTLEAGESVRPEDLPSKSHERRDARIREDRERERAYREGRLRPRATPRPDREDWRERSPGAVIAPRAEADDDDQDEDGSPSLDMRGEPGTLTLRVEPEDASVYLDGRFIGTGEEISKLRSGLIVDPGAHRIEVVRPGRKSESRNFTADAGGEVELEIELDEQ